MQVPKYCIIPICEGLKFGLVHKFPSDVAKYNEWMDILKNSCGIPEKIKNCTQEQIKKRFFLCCRHFGISSYKNAESRCLNITAVPSLNLTNLNDYKLSKAYQLDTSPKITSPAKIVQAPVVIPKIKILNTEVTSSSVNPTKTTVVRKDIVIAPSNRAPKRSIESPIISPSPKQMKVEGTEENADIVYSSWIPVVPPYDPEASNVSPVKEIPNESPQEPPQNKLLALFEVTPDQYKELSERLSASERNNKIESLVTSFLDKEENETDAINENEIDVLIDTDKRLKLDLLWLRDHCRCEKCYDHSTFQRRISILDIPDDIRAKSYNLKDGVLAVTWSDDHQSTYEIDFLIKNQYGNQQDFQQKVLWTKESLEAPLKSSCRCVMRDYMSDPDVSKSVLESLHRYGVAFIDGVQPTQHNTEFVIRQLFPIHRTLFGDMWTFSDEKRDHSDTAYTNYYLGAHNDNTYFNDASGLQILHCILKQCTGGENFLIDGFQVANKLKEEQPEVFKRLTTTLVSAEYIEEGHHHKFTAPIIRLNPTGDDIEQIRFNLYDRAPINTIPANKIREFYSDLKILAKELENPDNRVTFKLEPGTVMIFDNWRVLHGRNAYEGKRTMTGCYVQRTEFLSALRRNGFIE